MIRMSLLLYTYLLCFVSVFLVQEASALAQLFQDNGDGDGPFADFQMWLSSIIFGWRGQAMWRDDQVGYADTGAEVFMITFSDEDAALARLGGDNALAALDNMQISKITQQNGVSGNPRNRYIWSMALDADDGLYVGTLNQNHNPANLTSLIWGVLTARPVFSQWDGMVDTLLRQWSGLPIFENDGAEIYYKPKLPADSSFELQLQTSTDHVGFRKMVYYDGQIYAGSANGPDGPYSFSSYDFDALYQQQQAPTAGAKVFTNALTSTTGQDSSSGFALLDDQGNLDSRDKSIRSLVVSSYSNRLFIGTEAYECAKLVIYNKHTGEWKQADMDSIDCTHSVSQLYDLGNGKILFGSWKTMGYGVYMLDETNGDSLTELYTPQWPYHLSCGVMEIRVFQGQLYVGVLSFVRGFALVRTPKVDDLLNLKRSDWEMITGSGFGSQQKEQLGQRMQGNDYTWSSASVLDDSIYLIGTFAGSGRDDRAQLWASTDGADWRIIESEVFDASRFMYGFRTMEVASDDKTIYIGSAVNMYLPDE